MKSASQLYKQSLPGAAAEIKYYDRRSGKCEQYKSHRPAPFIEILFTFYAWHEFFAGLSEEEYA